MLSFEIPTESVKNLQNLIFGFEKKREEILSLSDSKRSYIVSQSTISNIGASTRIENAILTDVEIEWIETIIKTEAHEEYANKDIYIKNKLSKDKERSVEEVAGYRNVIKIILNSYKDFYPLTVHSIKGLHKEMLKYHSQAEYHHGDFKKHSNSVIEINYETGRKTTVLKTAEPGIITEASMSDLLLWFNSEIKINPWPIAVASEFVFRFLAIHPFQDGNGRLSRLLFHLALLISDNKALELVIPYIALDRNIEKIRSKYYFVLSSCSGGKFEQDPKKYRCELFLNFMSEILLESFQNLDYYSTKYEKFLKLSETAHKVLGIFKESPESSLKIGYFIAKTEIPRRTVLYALNQLQDFGFLQRLGAGAGVRYQLIF